MLQLIKRIFLPTPNNLKISGPLKMVLVVRGDLKMTRGKTGAQCAHAAILCYEKCMRKNPQLLRDWCTTGQPKIVLRAESLSEIENIYKKASEATIIAAIVRDAGRTQLAAGTATVVGIGPDSVENIDKIAKHLKLL